jgi:hypothetical protein
MKLTNTSVPNWNELLQESMGIFNTAIVEEQNKRKDKESSHADNSSSIDSKPS